MIYTLYSQLDTTLYERQSSQNTGLDPILELSHQSIMDTTSGTASCYNSRIILKFPIDQLEAKIQAGNIDTSSISYYLSMRIVEVREIPTDYTIYAYPLSQSWYNGTGRVYNSPKRTDGASWYYRTSQAVGGLWEIPPAIDAYEWDTASMLWVDADILFGTNISAYVTSSYCSVTGGGTWWDYDGLECTQSYSNSTDDLYMNVTPIVSKWVTGSGRLNNDGFILMLDRELETATQTFAAVKYFGSDSNTIYVPRIQAIWDDSVFNTGSLTEVDIENASINVRLSKFYSRNDQAKIRIKSYEKYPQKAYTTQSYYTVNYHLPSSSYYEIRDAHTDEIIIPFNSVGTKISCDASGSYFNLWMSSFQPERHYRVLVKTETDGGNTIRVFDNKYYFKVTR